MNLLIGSVVTEIIILFLTFIIGVIIYYKHKFTYWKRKNVMQIEPSIPFGNITSMVLLRKSIGETLQKCYQQFRAKNAKFGGIYHVCEPVLIVNDPDLIKLVLNKDFAHFHDRSFAFNEVDDIISKNIFTLRGKEWRILRTKLSPTFTTGKLKIMFETFVLCCKQLKYVIDKEIEINSTIDIRDFVGRLSTDIIGSTAFGLDCNSLKDPNTEFRTYGKLLFSSDILLGIGRVFSLANDSIFQNLKLQMFNPKAADFFTNTIRQNIDYRERNHIERNDLFNMLLRLKNNQNIDDDDSDDNDTNEKNKYKLRENEKGLSLNEFIAHVTALFLAGYETTSSATSFSLFELAQNQELQDRARDDVERVLEKYSGQTTYEAMKDMKYLNKVIHETLRKYPATGMLLRKCVQTYKVPNYDLVIDKDTTVFIPLIGLHYDPEYYPDPMKFDPERFSDEEIAKRHPYTYLPFGEGPRICIGMRFAILQIKLILTVLLKNYKFTLDPRTVLPIKIDPRVSAIQVAKTQIWLRVEKISSQNKKENGLIL